MLTGANSTSTTSQLASLKAPSTGAGSGTSVTDSPSTSNGEGWPAIASRTGRLGSSSIASAATLQSDAPGRASSARLRVPRAITGSLVRAAAVRRV